MYIYQSIPVCSYLSIYLSISLCSYIFIIYSKEYEKSSVVLIKHYLQAFPLC